MDLSVRLFIALVDSGLNKTLLPCEQLEQLTDEMLIKIYKLSMSQSLAHIVAQGIWNNKITDKKTDVGRAFYKAQMTALIRTEMLEQALNNVSAAFETDKIKHIPLKGSVLRRYYPEPWMRTSCDIDILVIPEDKQRCIDVLSDKLGYVLKQDDNYDSGYDISFYSPEGVHLELHFGLMEKQFEASRFLSTVWTDAYLSKDSQYRYLMPDDLFYFHQVTHLAKHFVCGGCGVRLFMDIWLLKRHNDFNLTEKYKEYLKEVNMLTFEEEILKLADVWFAGKEHTELTSRVESFVMTSGTYGSMKNQVASNQNDSGGKGRYILEKIFPPYSVLCSQYPSLEGRKMLTPFYCVKRWFRILKSGRSTEAYKAITDNYGITAEYAEGIKDMTFKLGLK